MRLFGYTIEKRASDAVNNLQPTEDNGTGFSLGYYVERIAVSTTLSAVYAAVELISNAIAQLPIHIKDKQSGEIVSHPTEKIFYNGIQTKFILMKSLVTDMLIHTVIRVSGHVHMTLLMAKYCTRYLNVVIQPSKQRM